VEAVEKEQGGLFYLDGPGGSGKTFIECLSLAYVCSQGRVAIAVASSGIAALLLQNGQTAHHCFQIPLELKPTSTCSIGAQSDQATLFCHVELIIWDEAITQHNLCFVVVDQLLKDLRHNTCPFGGVVVVFAGMSAGCRNKTLTTKGDYRQCLPVIPKGCRLNKTDARCNNLHNCLLA
jgi:hypothetical protein